MSFIREIYPAKEYFLKITVLPVYQSVYVFDVLLNKLILVEFHVTSMFYLLIHPDNMKIVKTFFLIFTEVKF